MTPEQFARMKDVLLEARQRPADGRAAWVASACGDDAELRAAYLPVVAQLVAEGFLTGG